MTREQVTEESKVHEKWYDEAHKVQSIKEAAAFAKHLIEHHQHDYGTICHALSAGALAMAYAMNCHDNGGITGFQSGFVMWGFVQHWLGLKGHPLRLVDYDKMLYPQYVHDFETTITSDAWAYLQKEAQKNLANNEQAAPSVRAHWQTIVDGKVPFCYRVKR